MNSPIATELRLRTTSRLLQVSFEDGAVFELPFEYLRVHSPSAERLLRDLGCDLVQGDYICRPLDPTQVQAFVAAGAAAPA